MSALLHFVSRMYEVPQTMFGIHPGGSFVFDLAESLLSIFTFRKTHQDFQNAVDLPSAFKEHYPLSNQSLLLILILTNHCTTKNNQYRNSLFGCCDSKGMSINSFHQNLNGFYSNDYIALDSPKEGASFKIDFSTLYDTLCKIVTIDQATLLLYLLLHRNQRFYRYVMAQENLQQLVS